MDLTIIETKAFEELQSRLLSLAGIMSEFTRKIAPVTPEKWLDTQDVCMALNLSKRALQSYRDQGKVPYSTIGNKFFYKEEDIDRILQDGLTRH